MHAGDHALPGATQSAGAEALEARVVELETRLAFHEQAQQELSDALAALRAEAERNARLLRQALDELRQHGGGLVSNPADEPPPPHY
jgi:SlyX protein